MITRREMMAASAASLLLGRAATAQEPASATAVDLVALPGKKPLIRRTFRPENYETPLADLRNAFTPNDAFFVRYHLANRPEAVDVRTWRLRVGGTSSASAREWSLEELRRKFETVTVAAINQCSGNRRGLFTPRVPGVQWGYGAIGNAQWTGVRLRDVLQAAGVRPDALEVVFDGSDTGVLPRTPDFVKSLPIERALDENTLIAFEMNGAPLPLWNGAPARLVVPGWTATYWVKHLVDIRVEPSAFTGFWMKSGYRVPKGVFGPSGFASQETAETAPITDIMVNSLITSHEQGARLARGAPAELQGWAWDNGSGIEAVDVSMDGGKSWRAAVLGENSGRFAWRGFKWPLDTRQAGVRSVSVRATSRNGTRQTDQLTPNPAGYHHNLIQTLTLEVA
jgi:DMSO/TMAO reductase YedYZ molybdopterin-dependent catalytic subunit